MYLPQIQLVIASYLLVSQITSAQRNSILNLPDITCEASRIRVKIKTEKPFHGRVFLKGNSNRGECVTDFSEHPVSPNDTQELQVAIDYNLCNTERIRQLQPSGIIYANTLVVQFHNIFITTGDKAFNIRCFYSEADQTVTNGFDVSMIPTGALTHEQQMPDCSYTVRRATSNGPIVRSAQVGDTVYHRWSCEGNSVAYGMLVHSCYVENSSGQRTLILDENGCSLDAELLPQLSYSDDLTLAYSQARVFKYPDNSFIYFRCQIRLCSKVSDGCQEITPPRCPNGALERNLVSSRGPRRKRFIHSDGNDNEATADVRTPEILVLEENTPYSLDSETMRQSYNDNPYDNTTVNDYLSRELCTHRILLLSLFLATFVLFIASFIFLVYIVQRQSQRRKS